MTRDILSNKYFNWICRTISDSRYTGGRSYLKLLKHLHQVDFIFIIDMDGNRAEDGLSLRYRFAYDYNYDRAMITDAIDYRPCTVLEMIAALAIRCEEDIMDNQKLGNRTGQWFWEMIFNLGLGSMYDEQFDSNYTNHVLDRFMRREYDMNGEGGLFTINNCRQDLRRVEIWCQMCWYLDDILARQ